MMKKLFSLLLAASLMLIGTQAFAQKSVNFGYLNSTQSFSNSDGINSNGVYVGLSYNLPISGGLCFAPGVYYSMIGNKKDSAGKILGISVSSSSTFMEHALNIPLYLNYGLDLARDAKFSIYAGPTAQFGLASTTKLAGAVGSEGGSRTYNNYDNTNYNRFNVYLGGGVCFQASNVLINVGYDYGMTNLYQGENAIDSHRSNLKLGVGFLF